MSESSETAPTAPSATAEPAERIYFPELDGLRFIAFMMVYIFHGGIPQGILSRLIGSRAAIALRENGGFGVQLFFILSGYLIATLLLREEAQDGRVDLRAFWIRRILRIWPLYYLIVAIGFLVIPAVERQLTSPSYHNMLRIHLIPFLAFLGNWSMALVTPLPDWLSILWSVCVEEQFYVIVPLLIALVAPGLRRPLVAVLIAAAIALRWACALRFGSDLIIVFNTFTQFDTLLSGVFLALCLGWNRERPFLTAWLRWLQWPLYVAIGWLFSQPHLGHVTPWHRTWDYVWVWLGGVGVVTVAVWGQGWLRAALSYSRLVWLGKISYGLYMYHEIAMWIRARMYNALPWFPNKDELLTIATLALTIAMAAASYHYFERRFLELKRSWTRVLSRPV
jgi:peptidoglycan/LPS O-acetylase OafA/YrhL